MREFCVSKTRYHSTSNLSPDDCIMSVLVPMNEADGKKALVAFAKPWELSTDQSWLMGKKLLLIPTSTESIGPSRKKG